MGPKPEALKLYRVRQTNGPLWEVIEMDAIEREKQAIAAVFATEEEADVEGRRLTALARGWNPGDEHWAKCVSPEGHRVYTVGH